MIMSLKLTKAEARILTDVLNLIFNDPDWQQIATASDTEWKALETAYTKIAAVARKGDDHGN